ncbi:hypothetical protein GCG54_00006857 [Colletotrichum gloeosporioides]|uniref:Protein kinase domain-containing protein n=1 Tax=Colletotrichum gloeosporioides TaxID=474922 RepID=A0A8H4CQJ8_COLGL|nr:uncharacterized protein GCG54_00006857 [Colletotrichum gloeosporioides]KAF3808239.1 hypothetical protein GCG54_00006857 [Colletotrichum gloeosporioides]
MNLAQYLQDLFTDGDDSEFEEFEESLMEEGFAASSQSFPSTSPTQGILNLFWKTKASHELQVYELVRRLCIDIGHGLQSLHENNFTHGDLKPENVLIFQYADKVTAKLCDFGCAKGPSQDPSIVKKDDIAIDKQGIDAKAGRTKDSYLGTPGWIPPSGEVRAAHDFDGLRRCDLYVYGLVVCSSFLFAGRPYPTHPNLDSMLGHLRQLDTPGRNIPFSWKKSKRRIFDQVTRVLEDTMKAPEERGLFPWRLFGYHHKQLRKQTIESDQDFVTRFKIWLGGSKRGSPGTDLSLETKAAYAQQDWWKLVPDECSESGTTSSQSTSLETPTNTPAGTNGNNQSGPASYFLFDEDNSCHKTDMFKTGRRKEDAMQLPGLMILAILKLDADRGKLYYLARFRSRVPKEWWKHYAPNILQMALQAAPAVDIHTLAWLCRGPIGKAEVRSLQADRMTWGHIMTRGELDESSRLDRFLLLLQFGAHIDQRMEGQHGKTKSIYTAFLKSFPSRPAITNTLSMQVIWRVDDAMADNRIRLPKWTYSYVAHVIRNPNSSMVDQSERSPLVELPIGWRVIRQKLTEPELICYKDMFTQSMTLTKPKVSLLQMRQLPIGLLQVPLEGLTCHVDLLACMRAGSGPEEAGSLARRLDARFPYYGDAWFETEFSIEPNVDDVLGAMSNSRIRSFVARLGIFRGYDAAFMTGLFLMSVCLTGLIILAVRLMIHRKYEGGI